MRAPSRQSNLLFVPYCAFYFYTDLHAHEQQTPKSEQKREIRSKTEKETNVTIGSDEDAAVEGDLRRCHGSGEQPAASTGQ